MTTHGVQTPVSHMKVLCKIRSVHPVELLFLFFCVFRLCPFLYSTWLSKVFAPENFHTAQTRQTITFHVNRRESKYTNHRKKNLHSECRLRVSRSSPKCALLHAAKPHPSGRNTKVLVSSRKSAWVNELMDGFPVMSFWAADNGQKTDKIRSC